MVYPNTNMEIDPLVEERGLFAKNRAYREFIAMVRQGPLIPPGRAPLKRRFQKRLCQTLRRLKTLTQRTWSFG